MLYEIPIRLVIFDNDGTLMDTEPAFLIAHKEVTGHDSTMEIKAQTAGKTALETCKFLCNYYGLTESPESICARRAKRVEEFWPTVSLLPGADVIASEFKNRRIYSAIATASTRHAFNLKSTSNKEFVSKFDFTVTADDVNHGKPAPDLFLTALAHFPDIKPQEALVFEDAPLGIKAANNAGIPAVFVPGNLTGSEKALVDADAKAIYTIQSLEEFDYSKFNWFPYEK